MRHQVLFSIAKTRVDPPLTKYGEHDKMCVHAGMVELGSDANAACGGGSELSAWPRSKFYERTASEKFRAPQQEDAVDLGIFCHGTSSCKKHNRICGYDGIGRRVGFRFLCLGVWVRVPLSAPNKK